MATWLVETCMLYSCVFVRIVIVYTQILFKNAKFGKIIKELLEPGIRSASCRNIVNIFTQYTLYTFSFCISTTKNLRKFKFENEKK